MDTHACTQKSGSDLVRLAQRGRKSYGRFNSRGLPSFACGTDRGILCNVLDLILCKLLVNRAASCPYMPTAVGRAPKAYLYYVVDLATSTGRSS